DAENDDSESASAGMLPRRTVSNSRADDELSSVEIAADPNSLRVQPPVAPGRHNGESSSHTPGPPSHASPRPQSGVNTDEGHSGSNPDRRQETIRVSGEID